MNDETMTEWRTCIRAVTWLVYNQDAEEIFRMAYGPEPRHPDYVEEKLKILRAHPLAFIGQLGRAHQARLVQALNALYGDAARARTAPERERP